MLSFWEEKLLDYDYAIVGGGILGLYTAIELKRRFPDAQIVVLERSAF